jgi:transcriptional regulator with XRE-family HTH domain
MKTLREWRLERLLSIEEIAAKSGVSTKTVVQIEHGRQLPRIRTIRRLSEALDVQPAEVEEFKAALDELGKDPAVIEPRPDGYPVDATTSAGPSVV